MAIIQHTLPLGVAVDVSNLKPEDRSIVVAPTTGDIRVDVSNDGTTFVPLRDDRSDRGGEILFHHAAGKTIPFSNPWVLLVPVGSASGAGSISGEEIQECCDVGNVANLTKGPEADADETAAVPFYQTNGAHTVSRVNVLPKGTAAASAVDYATLTVIARSAAGAALGTVASGTTVAGWTANTAVALSLGAITSLSDGDWLELQVTKAGDGVQLPMYDVAVALEP